MTVWSFNYLTFHWSKACWWFTVEPMFRHSSNSAGISRKDFKFKWCCFCSVELIFYWCFTEVIFHWFFYFFVWLLGEIFLRDVRIKYVEKRQQHNESLPKLKIPKRVSIMPDMKQRNTAALGPKVLVAE